MGQCQLPIRGSQWIRCPLGDDGSLVVVQRQEDVEVVMSKDAVGREWAVRVDAVALCFGDGRTHLAVVFRAQQARLAGVRTANELVCAVSTFA